MAVSFPFVHLKVFQRYPSTHQSALQAWNAADELIWEARDSFRADDNLLLAHDRFGVLATLFANYNAKHLVLYASQQKAITMQLTAQNLSPNIQVLPLFAKGDEIFDTALLKMPKSTDLFEWYLQRISAQLQSTGQVIVGFMTKYFSEQYLKIAAKYFGKMHQGKAKKKARLLYLSVPKKHENQATLQHSITYENTSFLQYYGVFSAKRIDAATQFLLRYLKSQNIEAAKLLDVGTGNGILAWQMAKKLPAAEFYMSDDSALAIASAQKNMGKDKRFHYLCDDSLETLDSETMDIALSNPPFHFEFENNIEVSLSLFQQIHRVLKKGGAFYCVANKHLNYASHLQVCYAQVKKVASDTKYEIIKSVK